MISIKSSICILTEPRLAKPKFKTLGFREMACLIIYSLSRPPFLLYPIERREEKKSTFCAQFGSL